MVKRTLYCIADLTQQRQNFKSIKMEAMIDSNLFFFVMLSMDKFLLGNSSLFSLLGISTVTMIVGSTATPSLGYGFYQYGNGRIDSSNQYDIIGTMFPSQTNSIYDFGNISGFDFADTNLPDFFQNAANVTTAVVNAGNAWEPWANVSFGNAVGANGTGLVRLRYINTVGNTAYTWGFHHPHQDEVTMANVTNNYAEIVFGQKAPGGIDWNADNFQWVMMHELGHVLGLRDLYDDRANPLAEEFVDHRVDGPPAPDRTDSAYADNVMFQYNFAGNNYSQTPQTIIDNDEIAGVTWLWSSKYNQIVTGDLSDTWNGGRRGAIEHHGDQDNPFGFWTYRGSIVTQKDEVKPYIDIEFPGYIPSSNDVTSYPNTTTWTCQKRNDNPNIVRCEADTAGWTGNFKLKLQSEFTDERRVRAWVNGGREDKFVLPINTHSRVFDGTNSWPVVFGPTGSLRKDFGDAPESYQTLLDPLNPNNPSKGGPRYDEGDFQRLGSRWDSEPDGQPTPLANGDDVNLWGIGSSDDEDGVIFGDSWVDVIFNITRPDPNPYQLRAWWDTNRDGCFQHLTDVDCAGNELFIDDLLTLAPGIHTKRYNLPFNPKEDGLYSRFRLTWDPLELDVKPWGQYYSKNCTDTPENCFSHGEVEDYVHVPEPTSTLSLLALGTLGAASALKRKQK